jgi:hypothetical protein
VYRVAYLAPPSAALCPAVTRVACQDVLAHADPDECQWASIHVVAQKVDSPANYRFHPVHRTVECTVFPDRPAALGALAGRDAALRRSVVRFRASFQALVPGCPWARDEKARSDAHRAHQVPQPLDE